MQEQRWRISYSLTWVVIFWDYNDKFCFIFLDFVPLLAAVLAIKQRPWWRWRWSHGVFCAAAHISFSIPTCRLIYFFSSDLATVWHPLSSSDPSHVRSLLSTLFEQRGVPAQKPLRLSWAGDPHRSLHRWDCRPKHSSVICQTRLCGIISTSPEVIDPPISMIPPKQTGLQ